MKINTVATETEPALKACNIITVGVAHGNHTMGNPLSPARAKYFTPDGYIPPFQGLCSPRFATTVGFTHGYRYFATS